MVHLWPSSQRCDSFCPDVFIVRATSFSFTRAKQFLVFNSHVFIDVYALRRPTDADLRSVCLGRDVYELPRRAVLDVPLPKADDEGARLASHCA